MYIDYLTEHRSERRVLDSTIYRKKKGDVTKLRELRERNDLKNVCTVCHLSHPGSC